MLPRHDSGGSQGARHTSRPWSWNPSGQASIWLAAGSAPPQEPHLSVFASLLFRLYQPLSGTGYLNCDSKLGAGEAVALACTKPGHLAPVYCGSFGYCAGQGRHVSFTCA